MRGVWCFARIMGLPLAVAVSVASVTSAHAELIDSPTRTSRSAEDKKAAQVALNEASRIPPGEEPKAREHQLPSLDDLGLNLNSTNVAKRNELDSLTVQPWAPGRGALGVKLEVTW